MRLISLLWLGLSWARAEPARAPNFRLLDHEDRPHELYGYAGAAAVVLAPFSLDCPAARSNSRRLNALRRAYAGRAVKFLLLDAEPVDAASPELARLGLPVLIDDSAAVADSLGLRFATESLLIDPASWAILYRGPLEQGLSRALEARLAGRPPPAAAPRPAPLECPIRQPAREPSYARDVAPIIGAKCLNCHYRGSGILPALSSRRALRDWAPTIRETLLTQRMPPNGFDPRYGRFEQNASLNPAERRALVRWFDAPASRDGGRDPLPWLAWRPRLESWRRPVPDLLLSMDMPSRLPPSFSEQERRSLFQVGGPTERDLFVRAIRPYAGNSRVVAHMALLVSSRPLAALDAESLKRGAMENKQALGVRLLTTFRPKENPTPRPPPRPALPPLGFLDLARIRAARMGLVHSLRVLSASGHALRPLGPRGERSLQRRPFPA